MSTINTNLLALMSQHHLTRSAAMHRTAIERLSSGLRINSAKDDAAGQAIANRMTSQVRGLTQARHNASHGISMLQTMESGLEQINENLQRMRELALQASSGINTPADRASIQHEIRQRFEEIDRIAKSASFNGMPLLTTDGKISIQIGSGSTTENRIEVPIIDATGLALGLSENVEDESSKEGGETKAKEGEKAEPKMIETLRILTTDVDKARDAIDDLDTAIAKIAESRSVIGATHNRLESTIEHLTNTVDNLMAARSRIEDADFAVEVSNLTRSQMLQQAGFAVLAQANQASQGVLSLLRG